MRLNDKHFTSNTSNLFSLSGAPLKLNKLDVLDVKCLSFNFELQHIGMSSIKKNNEGLGLLVCDVID